MIHIQTRLDKSLSDASRKVRKYNDMHVAHALGEASLQACVGGDNVKHVASNCHLPYRRLLRLKQAWQRKNLTLEQAVFALEGGPFLPWMYRPEKKEWLDAFIAKRQAALRIRVEAAREAYQIANRTGAPFWKCVQVAAEKRGLGGKSLCNLIREGRIPRHWLT